MDTGIVGTSTIIKGRVCKADIEKAAEELNLALVDDVIAAGDLYLAGRNTGVKLLTCAYVHEEGWVVSTFNSYSYNISECYKVIEK